VGAETPRTRYGTREERIALPVSFRPAEDHQASALFARVETRRRYDSPEFGFSSRTEARTLQARGSDTWTVGSNRLTGFAEWNRWEVDDRSNFGVNLADDRSTLWGAGAEDAVRLGARWIATAGLRYDHHSQFGDAWSPRATVSFLPAAGWKLRASAGSAFRAPSIGELYYPFSGNSLLEPERSSSYEVGIERRLTGGRAEAALFWNDFRDLIVYDFVRFLNFNVGRARTRGVELAVRQRLSPRVGIDAAYTWLDAEDRASGRPLPRRPRHQAHLAGVWHPFGSLTLSPRATFVGRRDDGDALTGETVEMPSFVRFDLFARYELPRFAPYLRVENLTDRRYQEVNGYPAPRRRYAAGLDLTF
jgi:vitamin B12 transporter